MVVGGGGVGGRLYFGYLEKNWLLGVHRTCTEMAVFS